MAKNIFFKEVATVQLIKDQLINCIWLAKPGPSLTS